MKIQRLADKIAEKPDFEKTQQLLGEFLLTYSPNTMTADQALAKSKAFYMAVCDFPAWCIAEAVQRWHRREVLQSVDYAFPIPPYFRAVVEDVKTCAQGRIYVFNRILESDNSAKFTQQHMENMRACIHEVVNNTVKKV